MRRLSTVLLCLVLVCVLTGAVLAANVPEAVRPAVESAAAAVNPALVKIHVVQVRYDSGREVKEEASGSGVIFTKEGHVITNHHVAGDAKQITCILANKEEIDADRVGTDALTDISVLKLRPATPREFPTAKFGDSSALRVGDYVLAMGSPLALSQSVTLGIVSNTAMVVPDMFWPLRFQIDGEDVGSVVRWIGHDAAIAGGNSGGPLVNLAGEVVGINEISFGLSGAIPGNLAQSIAQELLQHGKVTRAWIGIDVQPLLRSMPQVRGVLVSGTAAGSPAAKAGLRSGDVIQSMNGQEVNVRVPEDIPSFNLLVAGLPLGKETPVVVSRGGAQQTLRVTPEERENAWQRERELDAWGVTARNLSALATREMHRDSRAGVLLTSIRSGGPADQAKPKLMEGDVIVEVDGAPVNNVADFAATTTKITAGQDGPVSALVGFDRRAERYLAVVKVGKEDLPDPDVEVHKAWLGIASQVLTRELAEALKLDGKTGVRVTQVFAGGPADKAGLRTDDILLALDGDPIPASRPEHVDILPAMIRQLKVGSQAELTIMRGGEEKKVTVTLQQSPASSREEKRYRDDSFDFTVRDLAFEDRVRYRLTDAQQGAFVEAVREGGWAALAHLAVGDLILEVDGKATPSAAALSGAMKRIAEQKSNLVVFHVRRGVHELFVELQPKWSSEH